MKKKSFMGVDVAKRWLDISLYDGTKKSTHENYVRVSNDPAVFKVFKKWCKEKKIKPSSLILCMEHTGIYCLDFCLFLEKEKIDYCMLNPLHLKRGMGLMREKNDKVDAFRIASYCYIHRETLSVSRLSTTTMLRLKDLMAEYKLYMRQKAAHLAQKTDRKNRLQTTTSKRTKQTIDYLEKQIVLIKEEMITHIEKEPAYLKSFKLLNSIVGIGPINAIATILHTNNFLSFDSPRQYACYLGIAPFEHSSGTSIRGRTRVSKMGAKELKANITQAARSAVRHDTEMMVYYVRKKVEGKTHGCIMNAIKFKLICRMFAVIKRATPFIRAEHFINTSA